MAASYIPDEGPVEAFRRGIPTSRRSSGMAVWMGLRAHGWNTIRDAVRRNIELTRLLERLLAEHGFHILPDGELSIGCARWEPPGWEAEKVDRLQVAIAEEVVRRPNPIDPPTESAFRVTRNCAIPIIDSIIATIATYVTVRLRVLSPTNGGR